MREHKRDRNRLEDILTYGQNVAEFIQGMTYEEFLADKRTLYSVVYNITVIGEAANLLTHHFRETYSDIPWADIVKMRNFLVHQYLHVSEKYIWQTAANDIPALLSQTQELIEKINWDEWSKHEDSFSAMDNVTYKKMLQTAHNLKKMGTLSTQQIAEATGLTESEVERLT